MFVFFGDLPTDAAGHAGRHHARGEVFGDDASRPDDGIIPDGHARKHDRARAQPYVVAYGHGFRHFHARLSLFRVERVFGGRDAAVRRDEHVVADGHVRPVRYDEVMVRVKIFSDADMAAVIAPKRRHDGSAFPDLGKDLTQKRASVFRVVGMEQVIAVTFVFACGDLLFQRGDSVGFEKYVQRNFVVFLHKSFPVGIRAFIIAGTGEESKDAPGFLCRTKNW